MLKTRIYIDGQVFQTPALDRGMGRYALSLIGELYKQTKNTEFILILSSQLSENDEITNQLNTVLYGVTVVRLNLSTTIKKSYKEASIHNEKILSAYVNAQRSADVKDIFLIPSLFQEPTCSVFPSNVLKCLIYFDAIPLLYYERYKSAINYENYIDRYKTLYEADKIFTISKTIADDLSIYFGIKNDKQRIINIDGACIDGMFDVFEEPKTTPPSKYILLTTSNDIRKNNILAIRAFEQLRVIADIDYKLVITSYFTPGQIYQLELLSSNLIFTGNISDAQLAWFYKNAEVVLFTSEYEGLGLPILEAVQLGQKVACSNIPVFREISTDAFYYFDPLNEEDITLKLYAAIKGVDWHLKEGLYKAIKDRYTWHQSAQKMYKILSSPKNMTTQDESVLKRPKVAILAPTPDGYSAIGKVVQELHSAASQYLDIHYYFESQKGKQTVNVRPVYLKSLVPCYDVEDFNALTYREYDAVIYHIGNSEYHLFTIINALHLPGIVVFHDTVLKEAFGEMVKLGVMRPDRFEVEAKLDELNGSTKAHFVNSLLNNQIAAITHSDYAEDALSPLVKEGTFIKKTNLPIPYPLQDMHLKNDNVVRIGLAGILSGRKGLDIIKELALDETLKKDVVFEVFGFDFVDPVAVEELKSYENVLLTTNLSDFEYQTHLANLDILINYRLSYRGETSLTVLEAMRYGCVVVVNKSLGWFSELPESTVVKVGNEVELVESVRRLVKSANDRRRIGDLAKKYIKEKHDPETYIKVFKKIIDNTELSPNKLRSDIIKSTRNVTQATKMYKKLQTDLEGE